MENKLSLQEAADYYGVSYVAVSNWIKDGLKFEYQKVIGKKKRKVTTLANLREYLEHK